MKLTDVLDHARRTHTRTAGLIDPTRTRSQLFSPANLSNLILWYDLSDNTGNESEAISIISDKSNSGRNGTCTGVIYCKHPVTKKNGFHIYHPTGYVSYTAASIRTVAIAADYCGGYGFLISDSSNYNWHGGTITCLHATYAADEVKNGSWRINGTTITPTSYEWRTGAQVITVVTTANVSQNRFGYDRTHNANLWKYYEVIFYSDVKSSEQIRQLELYLADKWKIPLELI